MPSPPFNLAKWVYHFVGPLLSLAAFFVAYYLDPLKFGKQDTLAAVPAFLFSVVILLIDQSIRTSREVEKTTVSSEKITDTLRNHIQVSTVGTPEQALHYILVRLPALREVRNTSFTFEREADRSLERFYDTQTYQRLTEEIASRCTSNLLWKDVGDKRALDRMRETHQLYLRKRKDSRDRYKYRTIAHIEPQLNFIILEFLDGSNEVLFNWDFRRLSQDPMVLISRNETILDMFAVQFSLLWRSASPDHDIIVTTRSDPRK